MPILKASWYPTAVLLLLTSVARGDERRYGYIDVQVLCRGSARPIPAVLLSPVFPFCWRSSQTPTELLEGAQTQIAQAAVAACEKVPYDIKAAMIRSGAQQVTVQRERDRQRLRAPGTFVSIAYLEITDRECG